METQTGIIGAVYILVGLAMAFGSWVEARNRNESAGAVVFLAASVWPVTLLVLLVAWMIAKSRAR